MALSGIASKYVNVYGKIISEYESINIVFCDPFLCMSMKGNFEE